jgi:preprotein translocase subunit SecE
LPAVAKRGAAAKVKPSRFRFVGEIVAELKKVVWPPRQQIIYLTVIVILVTIALGAILGTIDWGFSHLINDVIL